MPSNLTSGQVLPGQFSFVDFNASGAGTAPELALLIWGYVKSTAQQPLNQPFKPASQQEADDGAGRGSELASWYRSCVSQPESQGCDVWLMPLAAPSAGTASVYKHKVCVSSTNPSKPGMITVRCKGQIIAQVGFDTTDTAPTIAANYLAAINASRADLPLDTATISTDTVTIPYIHKGTTGEDLPFQVDISPNGTGVRLSPGQAAFATAAVGAGSVRVSLGAVTVSTALSGGEAASAVASAVAASWAADSYPLSAEVDGSLNTQVNFFFANDRVVRRMSAAVITTTGTTVNLGSGATDGSGSSSSLTYNGTLGVGAPSLTAALANLDKLQTFHEWAAPWLDTTSVGALATKIEAASDGSITGQKQQELTLADFRASSVAGALVTATSPNLTTSAPHYTVLRCEDAAVQAMDLSVRLGAARASHWQDTPQLNWNGFQFKGNSNAPIPLPFGAPSPTTQNTDLRTYALAPVVTGPSGNLELVKGRTTSLSNDRRLWSYATAAQASFHAVDVVNFLRSLFSGTSTVRNSEPKAAGIIDSESIANAVRSRMLFWENSGNYDGAEALADFVQVTPDTINPFRFNIRIPESPVLDLDQLVSVFSFTSPSA